MSNGFSGNFPELTEREFRILELSNRIRWLNSEIEIYTDINRADVVCKFTSELVKSIEEYESLL